ncbi:diguanylate cyclase [Aureibacillus halotolerans]|uniref:Diguanylate cyclase (GGDEF)-like protein n=1 Tax=Aureibacillus halotolerans TaxID=1508390 RepID=A0A4R6TSV0_9BACI|nr:diguanylate cyclase [Aureibacillus halotolerans]TDQ36728.1 diguanylate cyclase (GGDEF)-like protein [Aureibacillus halotolerans]
MDTYQTIFSERIRVQVNSWGKQKDLAQEDLYHLLHTIKGTAATIGLEGLSVEAERLIGLLSQENNQRWPESKWREFVTPLLLLLTSGVIPRKRTLPSAKLLLIDRDPEFVSLFKDYMEAKGYTVLIAASSKRGIPLFYDEKPNYVCFSIRKDADDEMHFFETIKEATFGLLSPTLGLIDPFSDDTQQKLYRLGVTDAIPKHTALATIDALIENRLHLAFRLRTQVTTDPLTKVFNRAFLFENLEQQKQQWLTHTIPYSIAMIDLDNFKQVNDTHGHLVGDEVLIRAAEHLKEHLRQEDRVFRYGGEEFTILLPMTTAKEAKQVIERVLFHYRNTLFESAHASFFSSFTAGVTEMTSGSTTSEQLLAEADAALYRGKHTTKGSVSIFQADIDSLQPEQSDKHVVISVVDDDPIIRRLLTSKLSQLSLQHHGVEVHSFDSGPRLLRDQLLDRNAQHIVLLDGVMPEMDGVEVLKTLRQRPNSATIAVVMLTGRKTDTSIIQALQLGADDYMTKPFSPDELLARVQRLIRRTKERK